MDCQTFRKLFNNKFYFNIYFIKASNNKKRYTIEIIRYSQGSNFYYNIIN